MHRVVYMYTVISTPADDVHVVIDIRNCKQPCKFSKRHKNVNRHANSFIVYTLSAHNILILAIECKKKNYYKVQFNLQLEYSVNVKNIFHYHFISYYISLRMNTWQ